MNLSKTWLRRALPVVTLVGLALLVSVNLHLFFSNSALSASTLPVKQTVTPQKSDQTSYGVPVSLKIPAISLDIALEDVDITPQGALGVPTSPDKAGWYDRGPRPGQAGSAVIDGHYGWWPNGAPAVFNNLVKLQPGDKLYVEDASGVTTTFVVRESQSYNPRVNDAAVFGSDDGKSHLNLITCEGSWDQATQSYTQRLVVFTDKE